ncbi:MAG: hypothetical protein HC830_10080, partial [Bacteroidetes bacterium]|nr:hypothetical protein [Bacteroidota bacterium]
MNKILFLFFIFISIEAIEAKIIYVKNNASGADNGTTWTNAYRELHTAITASVSGDTIIVAKGVYYPGPSLLRDATFQPKPGTKIFGSFAGNEPNINSTIINTRDFDTNPSILSGDIDKDGSLTGNSYHVVSFDTYATGADYTGTTEMDGFRIIHGNANGAYPAESGGGIFIRAYCGNISSPRLRNLHITQNEAKSMAGGLFIGTGCSMTGTEASPDIKHCTFEHNIVGRVYSSSYGGGIGINASLSLVNAVID